MGAGLDLQLLNGETRWDLAVWNVRTLVLLFCKRLTLVRLLFELRNEHDGYVPNHIFLIAHCCFVHPGSDTQATFDQEETKLTPQHS